jgi:DNA modification methylase
LIELIQIIHADVIEGLRQIPDQTVQCVVTSPPYWGLRDYGVEGQIGLEKTPEEFIQKMVEVFREVKRVLRDDGTVWLNLGDAYTADGRGQSSTMGPKSGTFHGQIKQFHPLTPFKLNHGLKQKDLIGMPWRVAFALQADGWYLRSDIIWSKPNPMPESVTDRPTKSHEYIFLLTKKPRYFYDADAVREPQLEATFKRAEYAAGKVIKKSDSNDFKIGGAGNKQGGFNSYLFDKGLKPDQRGRNRRTVWEIATQPFPMAHFATFPEALVEPCIKAGTSERGCCSVCGAPWVRVVENTPEYQKRVDLSKKKYQKTADEKMRTGSATGGHGDETGHFSKEVITLGWQPSCKCWECVSDTGERNQFPADTVPCIVLDPFGGSGTVGKVARDLKRKAILIELNADYIKIARERLRLNEQLGAFA